MDNTLRVWDDRNGACMKVLRGHSHWVRGALALTDGRILSWSQDLTLRLWDVQSGACLFLLKGHTRPVWGALELGGGWLLSRSEDETLRLWNGQSGACLEVIPEDEVGKRHPEWVHSLRMMAKRGPVIHDMWGLVSGHAAELRYKALTTPAAKWHGDYTSFDCLMLDGTAVITQANGQVCILKLHHGNRRISLSEAEAILTERKKAE